MNFIDRVRIFVKAGDGGSGCLAFLREKYMEFGGPNGADGGKGGDLVLEAVPRLTTLLDLAHRPHLRGNDGSPGKGSNKTGLAGEDVVIPVPVGTVVLRAGAVIADLCRPGERFLAARGGRGGRGNLSFKTRFNTAPRIYEKGAPGEQATLELELKLLADVGLVGLPNAGKSTLLSRLTRARPKIADYPFTTLSPNLGVAEHKGLSFVVADIPGLIEGAHAGKGLGIDFLRHIERTRVLIHLVDPAGFGGAAVSDGIKTIEAELKSYGRRLFSKPRILAVNKMDLPEARAALKKIAARRKAVLAVSAATGEGVKALLDRVIRELAQAPAPVFSPPEAAERSVKVPQGFEVEPQGGGRYKLTGAFVLRAAAMLDATLPEAVARFQGALKRIGVDRALRKAGVQEGDTISCGPVEFEWTNRPALPLSRRRFKRTRIGVGKE